MSGVKSVSRHEEASAGGGSFVSQGGIIATKQNLAIAFLLAEPPVLQLVPICQQGGSTKTTGGP